MRRLSGEDYQKLADRAKNTREANINALFGRPPNDSLKLSPSLPSSVVVPQQPSRPYSAPPDTSQSANMDILIPVYHSSKPVLAMALRDTGAELHSWISRELLKTLRVEPNYVQERAQVTTANGPLESYEKVDITFKVPNGNKYNYISCYVMPTEDAPFQILFSLKYMMEHRMVQFDDSHLLPMQTYKGPSPGEQTAQQAAEEHRRQEQADLERRREAPIASATNQGTSSP